MVNIIPIVSLAATALPLVQCITYYQPVFNPSELDFTYGQIFEIETNVNTSNSSLTQAKPPINDLDYAQLSIHYDSSNYSNFTSNGTNSLNDYLSDESNKIVGVLQLYSNGNFYTKNGTDFALASYNETTLFDLTNPLKLLLENGQYENLNSNGSTIFVDIQRGYSGAFDIDDDENRAKITTDLKSIKLFNVTINGEIKQNLKAEGLIIRQYKSYNTNFKSDDTTIETYSFELDAILFDTKSDFKNRHIEVIDSYNWTNSSPIESNKAEKSSDAVQLVKPSFMASFLVILGFVLALLV
ncbi:putative secreted protein [Wickerhamomyces ciferrii]|uniref:Secreted protein n=1 Tax=Wickerhamomyces ciferrii (strain ATCC 14091 / BCRC 22168 / CBS 111 / JCM 3599 / NBRC 0793 / NRRL Y-1031 F-60-10) TaxID=1206466 RepID=K0KUJ1_WICCF|nr:uncharacterized protein BN7_6437 [Wickerhamomyces ciferrii]CCH46836.1 putative secreted protein [Wickerhamomyces ciferrii]